MTKKDTQVEAYKGYFNELGIEFSEDIGDFDKNSSEYIKVDPSIIGRVDSVMQNVPAVLLGINKADTYRVIYDKGLGVLQEAANNPGLYRGNIVQAGKNNAIKGGVLLQELSMGPQIVSGVFSAMSMVTGQYYMTQINNKLGKIEKTVEDVLKFLEDDKKSEMESNEEFLRHVQYNFQSIIGNDDLRVATLGTIQKIKIDSLANLIFYKKQIGDLGNLNPEKDKLDVIKDNIRKTNIRVSEYWYSLYLYCYASYLEPIIARNFDSDYIQYVLGDMKEKCKQYKKDHSFWKDKIKTYIDEAKAYDDSVIWGMLKEVEPALLDFKMDAVLGAVGNLAAIMDKKDKRKKAKSKEQACDIFEAITPHSNIKAIESKQNDLLLYETINNGHIELVKKHDGMYVKLPA